MMKKREQPQRTSPEEWVTRHGNYLYRFALTRLRRPDLAENAVQETFLAALKAHKTFAGRSSERTWLTGILKHKIYDHFRRHAREIDVSDLIDEDQQTVDSFYDHTGRPHHPPTEWIPNPREVSKSKEFWEVLERCLKKLPLPTAHAFMMREIEKMTTQQICKNLNITATNLWVMLHRARLQLRACLEDNWFTDSKEK